MEVTFIRGYQPTEGGKCHVGETVDLSNADAKAAIDCGAAKASKAAKKAKAAEEE